MVRPKIEQHKTKSITVIAKVVINLEVAYSKRQLGNISPETRCDSVITPLNYKLHNYLAKKIFNILSPILFLFSMCYVNFCFLWTMLLLLSSLHIQ